MTTGSGFFSAASTTFSSLSVLRPIRDVSATQPLTKLRRLMPFLRYTSHILSRLSTLLPPHVILADRVRLLWQRRLVSVTGRRQTRYCGFSFHYTLNRVKYLYLFSYQFIINFIDDRNTIDWINKEINRGYPAYNYWVDYVFVRCKKADFLLFILDSSAFTIPFQNRCDIYFESS